jgi:hypothetical protein
MRRHDRKCGCVSAPGPTDAAAPDAELIALCDRIVAINVAQTAICARYPGIGQEADDDPIDGAVLDVLSAEWHQIKSRISNLSIVTPAGADAAGRAAHPEAKKPIDGQLTRTDLYELLALKLVEYHAGRPVA